MTERAKKKAELKRLIRRTCKKMTPPEVIRERMDWLEEDGVSFFSHFFKDLFDRMEKRLEAELSQAKTEAEKIAIENRYFSDLERINRKHDEGDPKKQTERAEP